MKLLLLLFLITLISCEGGATGGGDQPIGSPISSSTTILYDSLSTYATWNNGGTVYERSLGSLSYLDEVKLPSLLSVTVDQNNSLRVGDTAYIMVNNYFNNRCEYIYNGTSFIFGSCKSDVAGFLSGDTIVAANYPHPSFGVTREVVIMLYGRLAIDLHTGSIKINGVL